MKLYPAVRPQGTLSYLTVPAKPRRRRAAAGSPIIHKGTGGVSIAGTHSLSMPGCVYTSAMAQSQTAATTDAPTQTSDDPVPEPAPASRVAAYVGHADGQTATLKDYTTGRTGVRVRNADYINARRLRNKFGWHVGTVIDGNVTLVPMK